MTKADQARLKIYQGFIKQRRAQRGPAKVFRSHSQDVPEIASLIAAGGVVIMPWWQKGTSTMAILTCFDNTKSTRLLNKIKGRQLSQPQALGYLPEYVDEVADVENALPLNKAARRLDKNIVDILKETHQYTVGFRLVAKGNLPKITILEKIRNEKKVPTIMVMGALPDDGKFDIYNEVLKELFLKFDKLLVGSSANVVGKKVYALHEQDEALEEFKYLVDGFVKHPHPLKTDLPPLSSTLIDLTREYPVVERLGNADIEDLKKIFDDLVIEE